MAKPLQVVFGSLGKNSATAVVFSLVNTTVTLVVNGVTQATISMSAMGDDRFANDDNGETIAGYIGNIAILNLPANSTIQWSATQGADTDSGSFHTSGTPTNDFALAFTTCLNSRDKGIVAWDLLEAYMKNESNPPVLSIIHADDVFYADGFFSGQFSFEEMTSAQGKVAVKAEDYISGQRPKYNFACWYLTWAGLLDGWVTDSGLSEMGGGAYPSWRYCLNNTCFMPQKGDHEYLNDIWSTDLTATPNQLHATPGGFDGNAHVIYNQCMQPLHGNSIANNYADGSHWAQTFGGVNVIAYDPISNPVGALSLTQWLGANQIIDALDSVKPEHVFTVSVHPASGYRGFDGIEPPAYKYEGVTVIAETELEWVETGNNPMSFMENPATNGTTGNCVMMRGDWHEGINLHWFKSAETGKAKENFYELALSTVSQSSGSTLTVTPTMEVAMAEEFAKVAGGVIKDSFVDTGKQERKFITILEYFGSRSTKETIIKQYSPVTQSDGVTDDTEHFWDGYDPSKNITDRNGIQWGIIFEKKFVQFNDNAGFDIDQEPDYQLPESVSGQAGTGIGI